MPWRGMRRSHRGCVNFTSKLGEIYINISYFQTPYQMTGRFGDFWRTKGVKLSSQPVYEMVHFSYDEGSDDDDDDN